LRIFYELAIMQMEWNLTLNPIFSEVFGTQGFSNPKKLHLRF